MKIAIQPDNVVHRNGEVQSYSDRWKELADAAGVRPLMLDAYDRKSMDTVSSCDGVMWRFSPDYSTRVFAKRFLQAVELGLGIPVFPDYHTRWHVEDKLAQHDMFRALGVPTPATWVLRDREEALSFLAEARYPLVLKLSSGFQSQNVRLIRQLEEGRYWVDQLFGPGVTSLGYAPAARLRRSARNMRRAVQVLQGRPSPDPGWENELHRGYLYLQEFVPRNPFDTRVTVIGDRAFGFRRLNRPNDFRASGSGQIDWDPRRVDLRTVNLAFRIANDLRAQTVAIDAINGENGEVLVLELTLTYASWAIRRCPGFWRRSSNDTHEPIWVPGSLGAEEAIFEDFRRRLILAGPVGRRTRGVAEPWNDVYKHGFSSAGPGRFPGR